MPMSVPPLTFAERRERLALVCQLDRLRLRLALRPSHEITIAGLPATSLKKALSAAQLFPGRLGRLARGFAVGSALFRLIQPLLHSPRP